MIICFKYPEHTFLPEIFAYKKFFEKMGVQVITNRISPDCDVYWEMMGFHITRSASAKIHIDEYCSASTPPFRSIKDTFKKILNRKPDYRLFLNPYVCDSFNFNDDIPYGYRDMGIESIVTTYTENKRYDFIYAGSLDRQRKIELLLQNFTNGSMKNFSILILSKAYTEWQQTYRKYRNIFFAGPCEPSKVPAFLKQARYGINFIPDTEPFNHQTSTKLLEYAASGLPVISTDYYWVRAFEKQYGGRFFYLNKDFSNFNMESVAAFKFGNPDVSGWSWDNQIRNSGVLQFLDKTFPGFLGESRKV